jgi:hypothetical protein
MAKLTRDLACLSVTAIFLCAQKQPVIWNDQEKPIVQQLRGLRQLPDDKRAVTTKELAIEIRRLPAGGTKLSLAGNLANLATEGDIGHDALQEVATTLAESLRESPAPEIQGQPAAPYLELARLARYEHVQASLDDPQFAAAITRIEQDDQVRQKADFVLTDLR